MKLPGLFSWILCGPKRAPLCRRGRHLASARPACALVAGTMAIGGSPISCAASRRRPLHKRLLALDAGSAAVLGLGAARGRAPGGRRSTSLPRRSSRVRRLRREAAPGIDRLMCACSRSGQINPSYRTSTNPRQRICYPASQGINLLSVLVPSILEAEMKSESLHSPPVRS
jgi:hypothetical protein